jgi:ferredoxin
MRRATAPERRSSPTARLIVDPVACDGIGMCAHLAPMLISLDSWGYPIVPRTPLEPGDRRAAQAAVAGCPRRALALEP